MPKHEINGDIEDQIARGFETVARRFDERGQQIQVLSTDLTKVAAGLEHLTKTMERLDKDITNMNLQGLRVEVANCEADIKELKEAQKRNNWFVITSLIMAVIGLLSFIAQFAWNKVIK